MEKVNLNLKLWNILIFLFLLLNQCQGAEEGQACQPYYGQYENVCGEETKMECIFGRCACPTGKSYRNIRLNTVWYGPWNKCVSIYHSACDLDGIYNGGTSRSGSYQCEPGVRCVPKYRESSDSGGKRYDNTVGICGGTISQPQLWIVGILTAYSVGSSLIKYLR